MDGASIAAFFVYGTLKSNQIRGKMWPRVPLRVRAAIAAGTLFDLGPYPAMVPGDDWVSGELWEFELQDMPSVTERLDSIEGYCIGSTSNLYEREIVLTRVCDSRGLEQEIPAYTYFYGDSKIAESHRRIEERVTVLGRACTEWPDSQTNLRRVALDA